MQTTRTHADAAPEAGATRQRPPLPVVAVFPLATLIAAISLVGIIVPAIYARETPNWRAQALGQDWGDLLLAVPWLSVTGWLAWRNSRRALLLLTGGLLYSCYEFAIYGFSVHFNALFLVYCSTLGISFFSLVGVALHLMQSDVSHWYPERPPIRTAGFFLIGVGLLFALLWLGEIVPALLQGATPRSISEAGTPTNPVFVLDLSVVLPLHLVAGVALLRRRKPGYVLAPVLLGFDVIMALSIAGMLIVMRWRGFETSWFVVGSLALVGTASAAVLALLLRHFRPRSDPAYCR